MPIFEYVCRDCSRRFEQIVMGSTRPACPACESEDLEKQLSVFAVSTRGGGVPGEGAGACGSCGDPRGPGSCAID
ncbi:MAG TPA: zinc ribbon domain-containing protein [Candidatus Polarisedimenticolia bacterium]|nr:zinc ribbon domain-containing protein [Candidatus Polarisedimenticolia bacterium]